MTDPRESREPLLEKSDDLPAYQSPVEPNAFSDAAAADAARLDRARPVAKRTRISTAWVGGVVAALLLILLLVFILQNGTKVPVKFLSLTGHLPLGVALLFTAIGGMLVMGVLAGARVLQLRVAARRLERATR